MAEMRNESDLSTYEEESDRVTAPPPKKQKIYEHKYKKSGRKIHFLRVGFYLSRLTAIKRTVDFV